MENDNIRENINEINEEILPEELEESTEAFEEEAAEETVEEIAEEHACEDAQEEMTEEIADEAIEEEIFEEGEEPRIATIDEAEAIAAIGKPRSKKPLIVTGWVALGIVVLVAVYCVLTMLGIGSKSVVSNPIVSESGEVATEDIRYQNPVVSIFNRDVAMTVNGVDVSRNILQYATNALALSDITELEKNGEKFDYQNFDWKAQRKDSKLSYIEYAKGLAVNDIAEIYAIISEGNKYSISVSEEEEKEILDWVDGLREQYGDKFDMALKSSGYDSVEMLIEFNKMNLNVQKVYEDISADMSKYVSDEKELVPYMNEAMITAKHILIQFEDETEGAKIKAKEKADAVYAEIMAGADFDEMVKKYNQDPGATEDGYTFANDGTMVQPFADAAFALEVGKMSEPVETDFGYHIIKRVERKPTADDYVKMLAKNAKVRLNNFVYDNINATVNLNDFLGK